MFQSSSSVKIDSDVNINMINGGAVFAVPITSCVPIAYIDCHRMHVKERYVEPSTTKAALMLRDIDQLFVLEIEEAYLGDDKFQRPLARCFCPEHRGPSSARPSSGTRRTGKATCF